MPEPMLIPLLIDFACVIVGLLVLWRVAVRIEDVSFIDAVWGGGMAVVVAIAWVQRGLPGGRGGLIAAMAVLCGARLGIHLFTRWRGHGEDPRYAKMLGKAKNQGRFASASLKFVFGPQAVLLFVTCLPAQVGVLQSPPGTPIGPLAMAGAALWALGLAFETVGDWQLSRFRADPASKGKVLDTGLWRYTRHPNYFGDACVWWGIWLAAAEAGWLTAAVAAIGPVFLTFTLTKWSGKPLLEKDMAKRRPGYEEFVRKTSGFLPWPPKG